MCRAAVGMLALLVSACSPPPSTPAASSSAPPVVDAGAAPEAATPRPFAGTPGEATSIITDVIQAHIKDLWKCVDAYRTAKGDPHRTVSIDVGTDQEGNLLGITTPGAKNDLDPTLKDCMWKVLHGLPFPRSHAGVITVRQNFSDMAMTQ
jgi:hypothetical protein